VIVTRNQAGHLTKLLQQTTAILKDLVSDYEVILIDNASTDGTLSTLDEHLGLDGFPNIQGYALTKKVDVDIASSVGLENALGDFVAILDPDLDDISFLSEMLESAVSGSDVVLAKNLSRIKQSVPYWVSQKLFNFAYKCFNKIDLEKDASHYRILSRAVVNFILQHPQPEITYRHLPISGGFSKTNLEYRFLHDKKRKKLRGNLDRGMRLLVSSSKGPMRAVTTLSFLGAIANVAYSVYILAIWLFKTDVAPGWVSLSLQQSGMFFMISLVLLVFGEYMLHTASLSADGPAYHIGKETMSARITRKEKLNVEEVSASSQKVRHLEG